MTTEIISELRRNMDIFDCLLQQKSQVQYLWKSSKATWCLLEVVNHLLDEEREDFRARIQCALDTPGSTPSPIDPVGWVTSRSYMETNYEDTTIDFLKERSASVLYLEKLKDTDWSRACSHPTLGPMTASHFLCNWLAHDYHHIRQINQLNYGYLKASTGADLSYAGNW